MRIVSHCRRLARGILNVPVFSLALIVLVAAGCGDEPVDRSGDKVPSGTLLASSTCKGIGSTESAGGLALGTDCIEYSYDGKGTLSVMHVNAAFNCCVDEFACSIDVANSVITIREKEVPTGGKCRCLCLYDLDYQVTNVAPGQFTIIVLEPYAQAGDDTLRFTFDLSSAPSGSLCVARDHYPWNINAQPKGTLVVHSECNEENLVPTAEPNPPISELDCMDYEYDGSGILLLKHRNAHLNCCAGPVAEITVKANVITITEADSVGMPLCDCVCPYDIDYRITNIRPEEYTIKVVEPYRRKGEVPLDFTVDLWSAPNGSHCVGL